MSEKGLALFVIMLGLAIYWLNSQGKLFPTLTAVVEPSPSNDNSGKLASLASIALALGGYMLLLTLIPDAYATDLTLLVVIGALIYDAKINGSKALLQKL